MDSLGPTGVAVAGGEDAKAVQAHRASGGCPSPRPPGPLLGTAPNPDASNGPCSEAEFPKAPQAGLGLLAAAHLRRGRLDVPVWGKAEGARRHHLPTHRTRDTAQHAPASCAGFTPTRAGSAPAFSRDVTPHSPGPSWFDPAAPVRSLRGGTTPQRQLPGPRAFVRYLCPPTRASLRLAFRHSFFLTVRKFARPLRDSGLRFRASRFRRSLRICRCPRSCRP
jgi:hypothetical protein